MLNYCLIRPTVRKTLPMPVLKQVNMKISILIPVAVITLWRIDVGFISNPLFQVKPEIIFLCKQTKIT